MKATELPIAGAWLFEPTVFPDPRGMFVAPFQGRPFREALGFSERGEGASFVLSGESSLAGRTAVNTGGGLLSRGHPLGATGVVQVVELVAQLRGETGANQVAGAGVGVAHCTGGGIWGVDNGAAAVHVLARR